MGSDNRKFKNFTSDNEYKCTQLSFYVLLIAADQEDTP